MIYYLSKIQIMSQPKIFDIEALHKAIMSNDWGVKISQGDSFYRLIFKLEKQGQDNIITNDEMKWLFASYKIWFAKTEELLTKCNDNSQGSNEAHELGGKLKKDIILHLHSIVTESKAETPDWNTRLMVMADIEGKRMED